MSQCKNVNNARTILENASAAEDNQAVIDIDAVCAEDVTVDKENEVMDAFESGTQVTEEELTKKLLKIYNGNKKAVWVSKLRGVLKGNHIRRAIMLADIEKEALMIGSDKLVYKNGKVDLMSLPEATVKKMYWKSFNWASRKDGLNGWYNKNFVIPYTRPKYLKYKDETGSFAIIEGNVSGYLTRVQKNAQKFLGGWAEKIQERIIIGRDKKPKKQQWTRDYGMDDIQEDVINLGKKIANVKGVKEEDAIKYVNDFFHYYARGWIKLDRKAKKFYIHNKYAPVIINDKSKGTNTVKKYDTGDEVFDWQEPIEIEAYDVEKHGNLDLRVQSFLKQHIELSDEIKNELFTAKKKALQIHDEFHVFLNGKEHTDPNTGKKTRTKGAFAHTQEKLLEELQIWFTNPQTGETYTKEQIAAVVFNNDTDIEIPQHLVDTIDQLKDFTQFNIFETMFLETQEMGYKNRLPIQRDPYTLPMEMDMALDAMEKKKTKLEERLKNKDLNKNDRMMTRIEHRKTALGIAKFKKSLQAIDNNPIDEVTGHTIMARRDSVYTKHISNALDPMTMRTDRNVYSQYIHNNLHTIERNNMTVALLQSLRQAGDNQAAKDAAISLYKGTMGHPDARTLVPIFGDISPGGLSRRLGKYGLNIDERKLNDRFQLVNKYVAGWALGGVGTAAINSFQNFQKITELGYGRFKNAWGYYSKTQKNDTQWPGLKRLLEISNVTQFSDYFSDSLIGEMESREKGYDVAHGVMKSMMKYHKNVKKDSQNESKYYDEFLKEATKLTLKTKGSQYGVPIIIEMEELRKRNAFFRTRRMHEIMNKFANFSINKQYTPKYSKGGKANPLNWMKGISKAYTSIFDVMPVTMGKTEAWTRSTSFVAGVQSYLKAHGEEVLPHELIERTERVEKGTGRIRTDSERARNKKVLFGALNAGRDFADRLDFALEAPQYGEAHRTPIGRLFYRFASWSQQKFGKDARMVYNAYLTEKDADDWMSRGSAGVKTIFKSVGTSAKTLRESNQKDMAALRSFYLQGLFTVMYDFFLVAPVMLRIPVVGTFMRNIPGMRKLGGGTSDMVSLLTAIPMYMLKSYIASEMGDDDEKKEEDFNKAFTHFFRHLQFGVGVGFTYDTIENLIGFIAAKDTEKMDHVFDQAKYGDFTGAYGLGIGNIAKTGKDIYKDLSKDKGSSLKKGGIGGGGLGRGGLGY